MLTELLTDGYRLISGAIGYVSEGNFIYPERPLNGVYLGILLTCLLILAFIYGISRGKYAYRVIKHTLYFE